MELCVKLSHMSCVFLQYYQLQILLHGNDILMQHMKGIGAQILLFSFKMDSGRYTMPTLS